MGREIGGYIFLARDREPHGMASYGGERGASSIPYECVKSLTFVPLW